MNHKEIVANLPKLPGVYLFKDRQGTILYIGKAKSLQKRVASYFTKQATDWKVQALINEFHTIAHIITKSEHDALLLEADLVQEHKPKYNVLLTSGQPFVFIAITRAALPQLVVTRSKSKPGTYFGPFIHKQQARTACDYLRKTFALYVCNKTIENGCLDYHLGLCAGTCKSDFNPTDYLCRLELATRVLQKDRSAFLEKIQTEIVHHTRTLEFEKAKNLYGYQQNIDHIFQKLAAKFDSSRYKDQLNPAYTALENMAKTYTPTAIELQKLVGADNPIHTIDCFDISHFQSSYIVGSCIRFFNGKPMKNKFRKFKIKTLVEQNDYAALYEIVRRRYKEGTYDLPDLVVIDGGKGQRNAVLPLFYATPCVSIAKKEELLFTQNHPEGTPLDVTTNIGKLLIELRDYAHHFAITYHRTLRNKHFLR